MRKLRSKCSKVVSAAMDVLTNIDAAGTKVEQELLQAGSLLLWLVTAVVYDNIEIGHLLPKFAPEIAISLIADKDLCIGALIFAARWHDVYSIIVRFGTEIAAPHIETAALVQSDLQQMDRLVAEGLEGPVINVKIMGPFLDGTPH